MSMQKKSEKEILKVINENVENRLSGMVTPETLFADQGLDSIQYITIAVKLEDAFGIEFDDDMIFGTFENVQSIMNYVIEKSLLIKLYDELKIIIKPHLRDNNEQEIGDINFLELGLDSIKYIDVIINVEEKYDFSFDDEKLIFGYLTNINEMARYIFAEIN